MSGSHLDFSRSIELLGNEVRLEDRLTNRSANREPFLRALHPLLRLQAGDRLELPPTTRALLNGASWLDHPGLNGVATECTKIIAAPVTEGFAAIRNRVSDDRLEFKWSPAEDNVLGGWLAWTRTFRAGADQLRFGQCERRRCQRSLRNTGWRPDDSLEGQSAGRFVSSRLTFNRRRMLDASGETI